MQIKIAEAFKDLFKPKRFKVYYGGRGGAKSWAIAQALLLQGAEEKLTILCTREYQGSIKDSVHRLLTLQIERLGLSSFYDVVGKEIRGKNGTLFIFQGLWNNVTEIKSMEGVDRCWCEEADNISESSWDILIPTIRKEGSEIWLSFNPNDEMASTYQDFVINERPNSIVKKVSYVDNPWFTDVLREEMELCRATNYNKYLHVWEGQPNADYSESIIKPEWFDAAIDSHIKLKWKPLGVKCLGFDPADEGTDAKAYAVRHGSLITDVTQWKDSDLADAIDRTNDAVYDHKITRYIYDSVGIGAAIKVLFKNRIDSDQVDIQGFSAGETPSDPNEIYEDDKKNKEVFKNKRAQWWWFLRDRFEKTYRAVEKGEYCDPDKLISISSEIKELGQIRSELAMIKRKRGTANTLIQIIEKKDMPRSPNMGDAIMMCFAGKAKAKAFTKPINIDRSWVV